LNELPPPVGTSPPATPGPSLASKALRRGLLPEKRVPRYGGTASIASEAATIYLSQPYTEGYYFFYQDHLGSTRQLSQSDMQRDYRPYGEVVTAAGNDETAYQFSGKEKDLATGFGYFGARYYYPGIGRWLVPDPADVGWSPYAYCANQPVVMVDPDGRHPLLIGALFMGAYSAGSAYIAGIPHPLE